MGYLARSTLYPTQAQSSPTFSGTKASAGLLKGSYTASDFAHSQGGQLESKPWRAHARKSRGKLHCQRSGEASHHCRQPYCANYPFPRAALRPGHIYPHPQFQATVSRLPATPPPNLEPTQTTLPLPVLNPRNCTQVALSFQPVINDLYEQLSPPLKQVRYQTDLPKGRNGWKQGASSLPDQAPETSGIVGPADPMAPLRIISVLKT